MHTRDNDEYAQHPTRVPQDLGGLCHSIAKISGVDISIPCFFTFISRTLLFCPVISRGFHISLENPNVKDTGKRENTWPKGDDVGHSSLDLKGDVIYRCSLDTCHSAKAERT